MLVALGGLFGGLFFPAAISNAHLNSTPVTPLADVRPGETVKVFAAVAANQSEVIHGYWGRTSNGLNSWKWTAKNFWITQGPTSIFVEVSTLIYVSEPGNPWGSENGVVNYSGESPIAIYGATDLTPNGTTLEAQYIAPSPTEMGHVAGYLWPVAAGTIVATGSASVAGFIAVRYQRNLHSKATRSRPPTQPAPHLKPAESKGPVTTYANARLATLVRRSWFTTAGTGVALVLAVPLYFVNFLLGIVLGCMGGVYFIASFRNRYAYGKSPTVVITDDRGLSIDPLSPVRYVDDRYVPWGAIANFYVYFGQTLALRTDRGELVLHYLSKDLVAQIASEMQARGIRSDEEPTVRPLVGIAERPPPLRPLGASEWEERNRLSQTRFAYSFIAITALTVGVTLFVSSFFFSGVSRTTGSLVLLLSIGATGVSLLFMSRLSSVAKRPTPGDEAIAAPPSLPSTEGVSSRLAAGPAQAPGRAGPASSVPQPPPAPPAPPATGPYSSFPRQPPPSAPQAPVPVEVSVAPVRDYWASPAVEMPKVFPRGLLLPGERVLYEVRPTYWGIYGPPTVLLGILMAFFLLPVTQPGYLLNPFFYIFEGLPILAFALFRRAWKGLAFALTNQRVLTVNGRRGTQGREGPLWALQRIGLEGLSGSVITFYFDPNASGAGATPRRTVRWPGVPGAAAAYSYIQQLVANTARTAPVPPSPNQSHSVPVDVGRFCPVCGQKNARASAFCVKCGKSLPPPP